MYTEMRSSCLDEDYVQRCNLVWWTVYILERRMTSLLGLPIGISEESITAPYPSIPTRAQSPNVMEMQVILCQVLAKVDASMFSLRRQTSGFSNNR